MRVLESHRPPAASPRGGQLRPVGRRRCAAQFHIAHDRVFIKHRSVRATCLARSVCPLCSLARRPAPRDVPRSPGRRVSLPPPPPPRGRRFAAYYSTVAPAGRLAIAGRVPPARAARCVRVWRACAGSLRTAPAFIIAPFVRSVCQCSFCRCCFCTRLPHPFLKQRVSLRYRPSSTLSL